MNILQFRRQFEYLFVVYCQLEVLVIQRHKAHHQCPLLLQKPTQLTHKVTLLPFLPVIVQTLAAHLLKHLLLQLQRILML